MEIYKKFENKLTDNGENVDKDFSNLVQKYLALFNTDFIYVDLLLEYMQKYEIKIPELPQDERSYYDKALYMFDNKLEHLITPNGNPYITDIYNDMIEHEYLYEEYDDEHYDEEMAYDDSCMEKYYNQNYKYLNLLAHILKELELSEIRKNANNILVRIESNGNSPQSTENMPKRDADWWMSLSPWDFEKEVAKVFKKQGYNVKVTRGSGDGGVDLFLTKDSYNIIVQCKQYTHPVSPEPLRALWGIKNDYGADKVFLVATAGITSGGENFISNKPDFIVFTLSDIMQMSRGR